MGIWVQILMLVWQKSYWQSSSPIKGLSYCWPPTFTSSHFIHPLRVLSAAKAPCSFWAPLCMVLWSEHSSIPAFVQCSQVTFADTWSFITIPRLNKLRFLRNTDPSLTYICSWEGAVSSPNCKSHKSGNHPYSAHSSMSRVTTLPHESTWWVPAGWKAGFTGVP